jgi:hypothetical protein
MAFSADWSLQYPLTGDRRNTAPVQIWLQKETIAPGHSARSWAACWPRHKTYCRTLCSSQWQRRLQSGVPGADLSRDSNYSIEIFLSTCRNNCRQPTSVVSKLSLPRLFSSLLTTAIASELLAMSSDYKEFDQFRFSHICYRFLGSDAMLPVGRHQSFEETGASAFRTKR